MLWFEWAAVVLVCIALVWVLVALTILRYWRMSAERRATIRTQTVYHYLPAQYVETQGDKVVVRARKGRHATINLTTGPVAFFYVGRNGRGGALNHPRAPSRPYARIELAGTDFLQWLGNDPAWYRPWDAALFVKRTYIGRGRVIVDIDPRSDRALQD